MQKRTTFLLLFCAAMAIFFLGQGSPAYAYLDGDGMIDIRDYLGDITSVSHSGDEDIEFGIKQNQRPINYKKSCPPEIAELIFFPEPNTVSYEYSTDGVNFFALTDGTRVSVLQGLIVRPVINEPGDDPGEAPGEEPEDDPEGDPEEESGEEPSEEEFDFTFMTQSGGILEIITIASNALLTQVPEAPPIELYTFRYWLEEGESEAVDFSAFPATRDKVFVPYYEKTLARVIFYCGGLSFTTDVAPGSMVLPPDLPAPEGYNVVWREAPDDPPYNFSSPVTKDFNLRASYIPKTYTVKFILGAGQYAGGAALEQSIRYNGSATAPTVNPPAGKRFAGWDINFTCVASNLDVRALYDDLELLVTFIFTSQSSLDIFVTYGEKVPFPALDSFETALPEGYDFVGWREANCEENYDFESQILEKKILYAVFEIKSLNIRYYDGYDEIADERYIYEVKYGDVLPVPPPLEKHGVIFVEWCVTEDLKTPYNFYLPVKTDIRLYARFSPVLYTVTTDVSEGIDCSLSAESGYGGNIITFTYNLPEGYLLAEKKICDKDAERILTENCFYLPNADVTLCLTLATEKYSLTVNVCGIETSVTYGEPYHPVAPDLQEHEVFGGWFTDEALTQPYDGSVKATYGETIYLYPKITIEAFDIVFVYGYGGSITLHTSTYYNELPMPPQITQQEYLRFDGWDKELVAAEAPATYTAHYTPLFDRYFFDGDTQLAKQERQALSAPLPAAPGEKEGMIFEAYIIDSVDIEAHQVVYRASYSLIPADDKPIEPIDSDEPGLTPDNNQTDNGAIYKESPFIGFKFDAEDPFLLILFCSALALASVYITTRYFFRKKEGLLQK